MNNKKIVNRMARQGDVLLIRFDYIHLLNTNQKNEQGIIALGEASGHAHELQNGNHTVYGLNNGSNAVQIHETTDLIHTGPPGDTTLHKPITHIQPGPYLTYIQREWNPYTEAMQNVQD